MEQQRQLSQIAFDRLVESVNALKNAAASRKEWQTSKDANLIHGLVYRYFGTLVAEGHISTGTK